MISVGAQVLLAAYYGGRMNRIILITIVVFSPKFVFAELMSPEQLIDSYKANRDALRSYIIKGENLREARDTAYGDEYRNLTLTKFEFRKDEQRIDLITSVYFSIQNPADIDSATHSSKLRNIWDGTTWSSCEYETAPRTSFARMSKSDREKKHWLTVGYTGAFLDGILPGDRKPIDLILGQASDIALRPGMEKVNETNCYVIDAVTRHGKYNLWIDPEHGFNIAKAKVHKTGSDILGSKPINQHKAQRVPEGLRYNGILRDKKSEFLYGLEIIEFQKIGNVWIPREAIGQIENRYIDGRIEREKIHHKRTHIDHKPNFEAISAFVYDFPEGTRVRLEEAPGIRYIWQNGKLIADVDDLVIDQLDKVTQEIMAQESVPPKLSSVKKPDTSDDEPEFVPDARPETQADIAEDQQDILSQSHALPVFVLILIGLLIIGVIGWLVFNRLKTLEK